MRYLHSPTIPPEAGAWGVVGIGTAVELLEICGIVVELVSEVEVRIAVVELDVEVEVRVVVEAGADVAGTSGSDEHGAASMVTLLKS